MIRIELEIEDHGDPLATKEAVAMALEVLGAVRVVKIERIKDGKHWEQTGLFGRGAHG